MMDDRFRSTCPNRWLSLAALVLGFAFSATAHAQNIKSPTPAQQAATPAPRQSAAAASAPDPVEGVTVTGRRPDTGAPIPDDKKAQYDAEVAREAAFREYRQSTPRLSPNEKGVADPNDLSKDFPGLQSYLPK